LKNDHQTDQRNRKTDDERGLARRRSGQPRKTLEGVEGTVSGALSSIADLESGLGGAVKSIGEVANEVGGLEEASARWEAP
jgi:hypothetical protein